MEQKINILGIAGSLQKDSFNKVLLQTAKELCPSAAIEIADISSLPLFNQDLEADMPESVKVLKEKIKSAQAILFATPEYNYSIPGGLKNALDWGSRPLSQNSFDDKPAAIMSAAGGMLGGSRAQYHLRQTLVFLNMHPLNKPEIIVTFAAEKIKDGIVIDAHTKDKIKELVEALVKWTDRLN